MAYPYKKIGIFSLFSAVFLLNGCTQFIEDGEAWPGVSAGTTSSAPDFTAPVGGGQFGQRTPPDVLQNTQGYRGEDLSATAPGAVGANGLYSYDSSKDTSPNAATTSQMQSQNTASEMTASSPSEEIYDPADPVEDWLAAEGSSVRSLLTEWGDKAGWRVVWHGQRIYFGSRRYVPGTLYGCCFGFDPFLCPRQTRSLGNIL